MVRCRLSHSGEVIQGFKGGDHQLDGGEIGTRDVHNETEQHEAIKLGLLTSRKRNALNKTQREETLTNKREFGAENTASETIKLDFSVKGK